MGRRGRLHDVPAARERSDNTEAPIRRLPASDRLSVTGNQLAQRILRHNPQVEPPGGKAELKAEAFSTSADPRHIHSSSAAGGRGTHNAIGGGQPLPAGIRKRFESRFGQTLNHVRIHSGEEPARTADALGSRAFTYGNNIVFGPGEYLPSTARGEKLLAHELSHVSQQQGASAPSIAKQGKPDDAGSLLPPLTLPRTGLTLFPGPLASGVLGSPIPLPGSLRLTNALSAGAGPAFVLNIDPHQFVGSFLGDLVLSSYPAEGTPLERSDDPAMQQRVLLRNVIVRLDPSSGRLRGSGKLLVPTQYPPTIAQPTELDVQIESTELGAFSGRLGLGPLHADFQLRLHYDLGRFERAAAPVFAPEGGFTGFWSRLQGILRASTPGISLEGSAGDQLMAIVREVLAGRINGQLFATQTLALLGKSIPATADLAALRRSLSELAEEFSHPGFTLRGGVGLGPIPLSRFSIEAPTTRPLASPLLGAPTAYPSTISAYGTVIAPAGNITSVPVPAFGGLYSRYNERYGFSAIGGLLPTISTTAISAHEPAVNQFPVYVFAETSYVRRATRSLDLGIRLSLQTSTPELFGTANPVPTDALGRYKLMLEQYKSAQSNVPSPLVPTVGLTVFGRWGGAP
jgi:hypothetical protein